MRVEQRETPRWSPTDIAELAKEYALIRVVSERKTYPVTKVTIERDY